MIMTLSPSHLCAYIEAQLNHFFPDLIKLNMREKMGVFNVALDRLEHCFEQSALPHYCQNGQAQFNHLHSDQYAAFLWFLGNTFWKEDKSINPALLDKFFYLNKSLHGIEVMCSTAMPNIFVFSHTTGTILGKAQYADYFVASGGCVVGQSKNLYPVFGQGVTLSVGARVIGNCHVGDGVSIGVGTTIYEKNIPDNSVVFTDQQGNIVEKTSHRPYARKFFKAYEPGA